MKVELHVFLHDGSGAEFRTVLEALYTLTRKVDDMSAAVDRIRAEVAEQRGATNSIIALVKGFAQALKDAIASGADAAELNALADELDAQQGEITAAVNENPLPGQTGPVTG